MGIRGRKQRDITRGTIVRREGAFTPIFWWKHRRYGNIEWTRLNAANVTDAETEVDARIAEFNISKGKVVVDPVEIPLDALWAKYEVWARDHQSVATIARRATFWKQFKAITGVHVVSEVTRARVEEFKKAKRGKRDDDQVKTSINNALRDFQAVFNRAIEERWIAGDNPFVGVERYKTTKALPDPHTEAELLRLLEAAEQVNRTAFWVVLLGGWAGLRRKEITEARWEWFIFDPKEPMIEVRSFKGFTLKDHEERPIAMNRRIFEALHPHRQASGFLFTSNHKSEGKHRYRIELRKPLNAALVKAGLEKHDPFQRLRVTFASLHAQKGTPIIDVSRWLGHYSVKVTERYYARTRGYSKNIDAF